MCEISRLIYYLNKHILFLSQIIITVNHFHMLWTHTFCGFPSWKEIFFLRNSQHPGVLWMYAVCNYCTSSLVKTSKLYLAVKWVLHSCTVLMWSFPWLDLYSILIISIRCSNCCDKTVLFSLDIDKVVTEWLTRVNVKTVKQ